MYTITASGNAAKLQLEWENPRIHNHSGGNYAREYAQTVEIADTPLRYPRHHWIA
jgi:hypothetical protein